jgi:hypothetical protein
MVLEELKVNSRVEALYIHNFENLRGLVSFLFRVLMCLEEGMDKRGDDRE